MSSADTDSLILVRDVDALRRRIAAWRRDHHTVALVPTMGALHRAHRALMVRAGQLADRVVATIFVNPKQFGPAEDLAAYPRQESADFRLLAEAGVHLLFAPDVATMYPKGFATNVHIGRLSTILDGAHRTRHFDGVATVVTKLLLQAAPDMALFGEKDYQQLCLIKRLVTDLDIPVDIVGVPTLREADGLALSSRNAYLTTEQRAIAPVLYREITEAATAIVAGAKVQAALTTAKDRILAAGFASVDYVDARAPDTLAPYKSGPGRVLAAARLGKARLIDNVAFG
jgi:pantoate--beta-alanine ligase